MLGWWTKTWFRVKSTASYPRDTAEFCTLIFTKFLQPRSITQRRHFVPEGERSSPIDPTVATGYCLRVTYTCRVYKANFAAVMEKNESSMRGHPKMTSQHFFSACSWNCSTGAHLRQNSTVPMKWKTINGETINVDDDISTCLMVSHCIRQKTTQNEFIKKLTLCLALFRIDIWTRTKHTKQSGKCLLIRVGVHSFHHHTESLSEVSLLFFNIFFFRILKKKNNVKFVQVEEGFTNLRI